MTLCLLCLRMCVGAPMIGTVMVGVGVVFTLRSDWVNRVALFVMGHVIRLSAKDGVLSTLRAGCTLGTECIVMLLLYLH